MYIYIFIYILLCDVKIRLYLIFANPFAQVCSQRPPQRAQHSAVCKRGARFGIHARVVWIHEGFCQGFYKGVRVSHSRDVCKGLYGGLHDRPPNE